MKSIEGLFPLIVISVGIVFFNFGLWGTIGGLIMVIGTIIYLYKNDRKAEFKIICLVFSVILVACIVFFIFNTQVTPHTSTTTEIRKP